MSKNIVIIFHKLVSFACNQGCLKYSNHGGIKVRLNLQWYSQRSWQVYEYQDG